MNRTRPAALGAWHDFVAQPDPDALRELLAPDVVFRSPAVFAPQVGVELTHAYLWAAVQVLGPTLEYRHEWWDAQSAVLRFHAVVDGLEIDGVDLIRWDDQDRIVEFTVMTRPFKALRALIDQMGARLR